MTLFSSRLPHVLPPASLARALTPTYAAAVSVDDDEAFERLTRAVGAPRLLSELYDGLSRALEAVQGTRTADETIDKLSKGVQTRLARVRAAKVSPGISAAMVRINLELGLAPEMMRDTLLSAKGAPLLAKGLQELGAHLLHELVK